MPNFFVNAGKDRVAARYDMSSTGTSAGLSRAHTMGAPLFARPRRPLLRRPLLLLIAFALVAAVAVPAFAASEGDVNVPAKFKSLLPKVKAKSGLAVRLPGKIHVFVKPSKTFADASATRKSY